jgi:hypothetical protein
MQRKRGRRGGYLSISLEMMEEAKCNEEKRDQKERC